MPRTPDCRIYECQVMEEVFVPMKPSGHLGWGSSGWAHSEEINCRIRVEEVGDLPPEMSQQVAPNREVKRYKLTSIGAKLPCSAPWKFDRFVTDCPDTQEEEYPLELPAHDALLHTNARQGCRGTLLGYFVVKGEVEQLEVGKTYDAIVRWTTIPALFVTACGAVFISISGETKKRKS